MRYTGATVFGVLAIPCVAAHAQVEIGTFHNPGGLGDSFGSAIAQDGDAVAIGAHLATSGDTPSDGVVYIYDINDPSTVLDTLAPSEGDSFTAFGTAIDIEGARVVVGARNQEPGGVVYVFDTSTGAQKKLEPEDAQFDADFGAAVLICGNIVYVGAPGLNLGPNVAVGAVYVFDVTTCEQINKFRAPAASEGAEFGGSLSKHGNVLMVGAPSWTTVGAAYTYDANTLVHLDTFESDDPQPFSEFGAAVALTGFAALIGAPLATDDEQTGAGLVCALDPSDQTGIYSFGNATSGDELGSSLAVDNSDSRGGVTLAIVGAPGDDEANFGAGAAYVINAATGDIITKLTASDAGFFDFFGESVSISGEYVIVGAPSSDTDGSDSGAAYLFRLDTPCPADLSPPFGVLDFDDVLAFLVAFSPCSPDADLAEPFGVCDFGDVLAFLTAFGTGCP